MTAEPLPTALPAAPRNALWQETAHGTVVLLASTCPDCERTEFPRLDKCIACGTTAAPVALGPEATLTGFTEVLHQPPDAKVQAPYTIVAAAFGGAGIAVLGLLDRYTPGERLQLGAKLHVMVLDYEGGSSYAFRLGVSP